MEDKIIERILKEHPYQTLGQDLEGQFGFFFDNGSGMKLSTKLTATEYFSIKMYLEDKKEIKVREIHPSML